MRAPLRVYDEVARVRETCKRQATSASNLVDLLKVHSSEFLLYILPKNIQ